jgi:hypothetical protein
MWVPTSHGHTLQTQYSCTAASLSATGGLHGATAATSTAPMVSPPVLPTSDTCSIDTNWGGGGRRRAHLGGAPTSVAARPPQPRSSGWRSLGAQTGEMSAARRAHLSGGATSPTPNLSGGATSPTPDPVAAARAMGRKEREQGLYGELGMELAGLLAARPALPSIHRAGHGGEDGGSA